MKTYKAKVIARNSHPVEFMIIVLICRVWRVFAVPFSYKSGQLKPYTTKMDARRGADKVAAELGINLKWEV